MDEIHGENAHLDLEYVLTLPTEQASKLRDYLLRQGIPENQIMVKEPGRTSRKPEKSPSQTNNQSKRTARFLPRSIKLGTYEGQYNVVMRRRTKLEGRETVWISTVSKKSHATERAEMTDQSDDMNHCEQSADAADDNADGGGEDENEQEDDEYDDKSYYEGAGDDNTDGSETTTKCRCNGAKCEKYRDALRQFFVDRCKANYIDENELLESNERDQIRCIYKQLANVLLLDMTTKFVVNSGRPDDDRREEATVRVQRVPVPGEIDDGDGTNVADAESADGSANDGDDDTSGTANDGDDGISGTASDPAPGSDGRDDAAGSQQQQQVFSVRKPPSPPLADELPPMDGRNDRKFNDDFKQIEDSRNVGYGIETSDPPPADAKIHGCDKPPSFATVRSATTVAESKTADKRTKKKFFRKLWPKNKNQHTSGERAGNHPPTDCNDTAMSVEDKADKPRRRALVSLKK